MPNYQQFEEKIAAEVKAGLSAREIAEKMVIAVLEAEYGKTFTLSPNFAKMVDTLTEVVVTNPDLRRNALAVASSYIQQNNDHQKNRSK